MDRLQPTPYHRQIVDYLRREEAELWDWFSSTQVQANYAESLRLELLKRCYRLHADSHPELAQAGREAAEQLGLQIPVTFYQAQQSQELNASLYFLSGEGHVVFSGPVLSLLHSAELKAVIGHELAHYSLWVREEAIFLVADRLIQAIARHPEAAASHAQTARRYRLYTEIFADRGALTVVPEVAAVVSSLVKMETGLQTVSGASYLRQAEEIFARGQVRTDQVSHPEAFIRARCLHLWSENAPDVDLQAARIIHGDPSLENLDLTEQDQFTQLTRRLLEQVLRPAWFQTAPVLAHAKMFFPDFVPARAEDARLDEELRNLPEGLREYFAWLLLDLCVADRDLEQVPISATLEWSRKLNLREQFESLLARELKINRSDLKKIKSEAAETLRLAEASA